MSCKMVMYVDIPFVEDVLHLTRLSVSIFPIADRCIHAQHDNRQEKVIVHSIECLLEYAVGAKLALCW